MRRLIIVAFFTFSCMISVNASEVKVDHSGFKFSSPKIITNQKGDTIYFAGNKEGEFRADYLSDRSKRKKYTFTGATLKWGQNSSSEIQSTLLSTSFFVISPDSLPIDICWVDSGKDDNDTIKINTIVKFNNEDDIHKKYALEKSDFNVKLSNKNLKSIIDISINPCWEHEGTFKLIDGEKKVRLSSSNVEKGDSRDIIRLTIPSEIQPGKYKLHFTGDLKHEFFSFSLTDLIIDGCDVVIDKPQSLFTIGNITIGLIIIGVIIFLGVIIFKKYKQKSANGDIIYDILSITKTENPSMTPDYDDLKGKLVSIYKIYYESNYTLKSEQGDELGKTMIKSSDKEMNNTEILKKFYSALIYNYHKDENAEQFNTFDISKCIEKLNEYITKKSKDTIGGDKGNQSDEIAILTTENEDLTIEAAKLREDKTRLDEELEKQRLEVGALKRDKVRLEGELEEQKLEVVTLKGDKVKLERELEEQRLEVVILKGDIVSLKRELEAQTDLVATLKQTEIDYTQKLISSHCQYVRSAICNVTPTSNLKQLLTNNLMESLDKISADVDSLFNNWQEKEWTVFKTELYSYLTKMAMSDEFSTLTKLYLYSKIDWVKLAMIKEGIDIDSIQMSFTQILFLFEKFGINIQYPKLFEDRLDDSMYDSHPGNDIFNLFRAPLDIVEGLRNTNLIIDLIKVGVSSEREILRMCIVSIPIF